MQVDSRYSLLEQLPSSAIPMLTALLLDVQQKPAEECVEKFALARRQILNLASQQQRTAISTSAIGLYNGNKRQ